MKKLNTHKKLPINSLEILQFYKVQLNEEIEESAKKLEYDYALLKSNITADNVLEEIVGDDGIHSDVMRYIAPFALKYRNFLFPRKVFKGMSGTMKKMQIVSFVTMLVGVFTFRMMNKKNKNK